MTPVDERAIEERLRAALAAEAALVRPHGHARAENAARLARVRRRSRLFLPLLAATATAAVVAVAAVAVPAALHRDAPPAAGWVNALDPRYRPTGPVWRPGGDTALWPAHDQLCWRAAGGGGDCRKWTLPSGALVTVVMHRVVRVTDERRGRFEQELYGVAAPAVTGIQAGPAMTGAAVSFGGGSPRIWRLAYTSDAGTRASVLTFTTSAGRTGTLIATSDGGTAQAIATAEPARTVSYAESRPRPLTAGVPLFTLRRGSRQVPVKVFQDGLWIGFGSDVSEEASPVSRRYPLSFGLVREAPETGSDRWWYGSLGEKVARVELRLNDGRTLSARMTDLTNARAFALHVTGVKGRRNRIGTLVAFDAAGRAAHTYRV
ncbi:hypothetical protein [Actinomadura parmotrematis]|uniref:Uncharacterized protein n=1 Tax=Actinomadura parmotrematis TaxID=2864039 RepID=A0ABS7FS33_9ACTN|nr:hypothetical protein [Actinomadura parmotrematis]MBW8483215.1 hypothetical protein [Actinomadura parmotrematis]